MPRIRVVTPGITRFMPDVNCDESMYVCAATKDTGNGETQGPRPTSSLVLAVAASNNSGRVKDGDVSQQGPH